MPDSSVVRMSERLAVSGGISARLKAAFRFPVAVTWNRLEGRPRSDDLTRPLRAEVRDPAWMLSRQWQLGEFEGQDAGAPVAAKLLAQSVGLDQVATGDPAPIAYDPSMPVEVLVERQSVEPDLMMGLYLGRLWLRRLAAAFGATDAILNSFRASYAVTAPAGNSLEALELRTHPAEFGLRRSLAGRSLDGARLITGIRQAVRTGAASLVRIRCRGSCDRASQTGRDRHLSRGVARALR